jgi:hypothetical protein
MSSKDEALTELNEKLQQIDDLIEELNENDLLPPNVWMQLSRDFLALRYKHFPPEICTVEKLWERIEEANNLMVEIKCIVSEANFKNY